VTVGTPLGFGTDHWKPCALVAQLDRASDFESEGREFESLRARHYTHCSVYVLRLRSVFVSGPELGARALNCLKPHISQVRLARFLDCE
jgi:hypothetical protein